MFSEHLFLRTSLTGCFFTNNGADFDQKIILWMKYWASERKKKIWIVFLNYEIIYLIITQKITLIFFLKAHVKTSCTIIYGMRFWDLEFSMFLTFSLFMNFQTRFHEKVCYFYILTVFGDLKLEYIGALFIFPFLLVWSWRYNDLAKLGPSLPPHFKISGFVPVLIHNIALLSLFRVYVTSLIDTLHVFLWKIN